tara:strand:+ start:1390 stop:1770 length:381 start_codon:yes stop_codon:yes gene_type:complete
MQRSFASVILFSFSIICFIVGILLLIATDKVAIHTMYGIDAEVANIIIKFLGSAYLLISILLFTIKDAKESMLSLIIFGLIFFSFINIYLLKIFSNVIVMSNLFFIFQILILICLIYSLYDNQKER